MDRFSLEDLATLSDEQALRRRFDAHNVKAVRWVVWGFAFVAFVQIPVAIESRAAAHPEARLALTLVNLALVVFLVPVFSRVARGCKPTKRRFLDEVARRVGRVPRGAVLSYLYLQYVLVITFGFLGGRSKEPWLFVFPFFLLFFRFATLEVVVLHASLVMTALVAMLLDTFFGEARFEDGLLVATAMSNLFLLVVRLLISRRTKKSFLAEWREERDRAKEQLRMRQELEFAREIQVSMLPKENPSLAWLDIASVSIPATEVGGDYYDYFTTASGKLAVVVGDVAGHGLASGLVLSGVRSCLALLAEELDHPSAVMEKIHRMLKVTAKHRMFVTLSILLFDRERSKAVLASAGHPPLLIRRASGVVDEVMIAALPLGAALQSGFEEREIDYVPGDVFVLHTDGIYEAGDGSGNQLGMARLTSVVGRSGPEVAAVSLRDEVIRELRAFQAGAPQEDDVTLVVLRVVA